MRAGWLAGNANCWLGRCETNGPLLKAIAKTALGEKVFWVAGVGLDYLAQGPDVVLDVFDLARVGRPLDIGQQSLSCHGVVRVVGQCLEQVILSGGQLHRQTS